MFKLMMMMMAALGVLVVGDLGSAAALIAATAPVAAADLKALTAAWQGAFDKFGEKVSELSARLLEIEQQRSSIPFGGGASAVEDELRKALEGKSDELRAMHNGSLRGNTRVLVPMNAILSPVAPGWGPLQDPDRAREFITPAKRRSWIRDLLPSLPTSAGATAFPRMTFTNNADVQGQAGPPEVKDGAVKAESSASFDMKTVPVIVIAHWIPASTPVLADAAELAHTVHTELLYGLKLKEDAEILNGVGGNLHLEGLLTAATAYNRAEVGDTPADALRRAVTQLLLADHVPNAIVLNPEDVEVIDLLKDQEQRYLAVRVDGRVWNVPVVESNEMPDGDFLVADTSSVLLRPRQEATIEVSNSHEDFFTRNLVAIRAELREALEIRRPLGLVKGSF